MGRACILRSVTQPRETSEVFINPIDDGTISTPQPPMHVRQTVCGGKQLCHCIAKVGNWVPKTHCMEIIDTISKS